MIESVRSREPRSIRVHGRVAPGFEAVRDVFKRNFTHGIEVGAGLTIRQRGKDLVNLWGGYKDASESLAWEEDTLVNVYSTTKGVAALAFAAVVEEGLLSYQDEVQKIWPEFKAARSGLTVGQLLSHQSGVPGVSIETSVTDMCNWSTMISRLEQQEPFWRPGTAAGYHAVHWGYLVGELVARCSGKSLGYWVSERLAQPLSADFFLGLPDSLHHRCADLIGPNRARILHDVAGTDDFEEQMPPLFPIALQNPVIRPFKDACSAAWRRAEIAAANGHASAQGIARIYDAAANGGETSSTRVLKPKTIADAVVEEVGMDNDLILNKPMRRGRGMILNTSAEYGPVTSSFGHSGAGGSLGFADPYNGIGFGYAMNQMEPGGREQKRSAELVSTFYEALARNDSD